jgi:tRNA(fMet)-specific endonuclease VapC
VGLSFLLDDELAEACDEDMRYLLETNVCVIHLNGRSGLVRDRLLFAPTQDIAVCSVVKAKLFYGAMKSNNPTRTLERQQQFLERFISLPFGDEAAIVLGQVRARLASVETPIGAYDLQIGAIALSDSLVCYDRLRNAAG